MLLAEREFPLLGGRGAIKAELKQEVRAVTQKEAADWLKNNKITLHH
jgi:hypothetical protein